MEKPQVNDNWFTVHDGENWWMTPSQKYLNDIRNTKKGWKGNVYCVSCYTGYLKQSGRGNLSIAKVYPDGCNTCKKKPKGNVRALAKFLQV